MKKIVSLLLTAVLLLGCVPGLAENTKHERVYVVTAADGTVQSVTDNIRLENADGLDEIVDRTLLTAIQNVGGKEVFTLDGEALTWQAQGKDITYEGTSDKAPAILPVVTLTVDGEEIAANSLKDKTGEAVLTVAYQTNEPLPALAVTVLPLPEEGVTDLQLENATVITALGRQVLVGWAVPGMDEELKLPASFSAAFHADHAELSWMMTFATSDPIDAVCKELEDRIDLDLHTELDEAKALLTALQSGEALPETSGKTKDIAPKINELNDGLTQLNDGAETLANGAAQLSDGASALKDGAEELNTGAAKLAAGALTLSTGAADAEEGASSLDTGLATIIANNEALNTGAQTIFAAILSTANEQLASSGLDAAGIEIPELTAENYAEVLDAVLLQLNPETLRASAQAQVETAVRAQVEANADQVRSAVETAVQEKVLAAVLQSVGQDMTSEQYAQAVQAGLVSSEQAAAITAAVEQQMATEEVKAQIDAAVQQQIEQLIQENTASYLSSDETIAAKLSAAQTAYESLTALKAQLDQIDTFVTGLKIYTDGVSQAAAGAVQLHTGLTQLNAGAATLSTGAATLATGAASLSEGADSLYDGTVELKDGAAVLHTDGTQKFKDTLTDAEKDVAEKLLPYVTNDLPKALRIYEETRDNAQNSGYDLRPENMKTVTVYIIRTDLQ
ncbi:MAG: hypothetical protein IJ083_09875 [Clostridia bacterium]|nr:hypothetical protein [Clostridia bacterium]MBQ9210987.1 hypothetical protein [Clostridia bacterium]